MDTLALQSGLLGECVSTLNDTQLDDFIYGSLNLHALIPGPPS